MNSIKLCGTKTCCPTLEKKENNIIITDDNGDVCQVTVEQGLQFSAAVEKLISQEDVLQSIRIAS